MTRGPEHPVMLAIAGDSAAGKTTLTKGLVEALGHDRVVSLCVDDYHRYDRTERADKPFTALHPDCNYVEIMEQHLQLLAQGRPILKPVYNHANGMLERPVLVEPHELCIAEGLLPLYTKASRSCFDLTVYLDPPERVRRVWKIKRDTGKRGYEEAQVLAELERREPESAEFIRPQRTHADIVVRFDPIEDRGESAEHLPSATILLRPTVPHADVGAIITEDVKQAVHLKLIRDEDGKPVDAIHVHGYASPELIRPIEEAIWDDFDIKLPLPPNLGMLNGERSPSLALTQLLLLHHVLQDRELATPRPEENR